MSFISRLINSIGSFFSKLFHSTEDAFKDLPIEQQNAVTLGVKISQIIKDNIGKSEIEVIQIVSDTLNLPLQVVNDLFTQLAGDLGLKSVLAGLEYKIQQGISDLAHNALFENIAKFVASILSEGQVNWITLGLGVVEYVYQLLKGNNKLDAIESSVLPVTNGNINPTPYQKCVAAHAGQCGTCSSTGDWTSC